MAGLGKKGKRIRHTLAMKQGFLCCYCNRRFGAKGTPLAATIEHVKARMDGGTNCQSNLKAACRHCNQNRGKQMNLARQKARLQSVEKPV
jgi:5-methylcytosine-specific restriction endonuclease McrA